MEGKICISCKKKVANNPGSVTFKCPSCTKYDIVRCTYCRTNAIKYTCPGCGFIGPN
ncbi:RNA-binding protein [Candidatus Woesearchaeota archaeon]|nr:RNA-binding protein [Candidatus Woesearchaeota archaeon]